MSGLDIKLADLQISDFHAPECCFLWWHTQKNFSFWGRCPQTPTRGFAPGPRWGPTAAPRPPHHFPPFSLFPQSHVWIDNEVSVYFDYEFTNTRKKQTLPEDVLWVCRCSKSWRIILCVPILWVWAHSLRIQKTNRGFLTRMVYLKHDI